MGLKIGIIGSGPAGLTIAYLLSKLKPEIEICLFDQFHHPRFKPCGGGLTLKTIKLLNVLGFELPEDLNKINNVLIVTFGKDKLLKFDYPIMYVIKREKFDEYLFNQVISYGVEFLNDKVIEVREYKNRVELITKLGNTYEFDYVIGADGVYSITRRYLTGNLDIKKFSITYMTYARSSNLNPDLVILDFTRIKHGYAWIFPINEVEFNVGLGSMKWGNYVKIFKNYLNEFEFKWNFIKGYPINVNPRLINSNRIFTIGEACGLVDPIIGEGIFYAIYSASILALAFMKSKFKNVKELYEKLLTQLIQNLNLAKQVYTPLTYILDIQFYSRWFRKTIALGSKMSIDVLNGLKTYIEVFTTVLNIKNQILKLIKT